MKETSDTIGMFEAKYLVMYFDNEERRVRNLSPEHMLIGIGVCPECGQFVDIVSDNGTVGRDEYRGHNYFVNHENSDCSGICPSSEQVFDLLK